MRKKKLQVTQDIATSPHTWDLVKSCAYLWKNPGYASVIDRFACMRAWRLFSDQPEIPKLICISLHDLKTHKFAVLKRSVTLASCRGQEESKVFNKNVLSASQQTTRTYTTIFRSKARMYDMDLGINLF